MERASEESTMTTGSVRFTSAQHGDGALILEPPQTFLSLFVSLCLFVRSLWWQSLLFPFRVFRLRHPYKDSG